MANPHNILAIRLSSFGDVLMTIPAVKALKDNYPQARITWLVEGSVGELLEYQRFIDEVIHFPRGFIQSSIKRGNLAAATREMKSFIGRLRKREYDLVVDFHGIIKSAAFSTLVRGKRIIGFGKTVAKEKSHLFYHERVDCQNRRLHKVERNMLIPRHLGVQGGVPSINLVPPPDAESYVDDFLRGERITGPFFAVNPFSSRGSRFKRWDLARYGQLIRGISARRLGQTVILWGPGEKREAERLREISGTDVSLSCATNVPQLLALLKRAHMYIGGDTGMMHLATLAGTPVVAVFGPTDHEVNGPYGTGHKVIRKDLPCSPCRNKDCSNRTCLEEISVDEVLAAVIEMDRTIKGS